MTAAAVSILDRLHALGFEVEPDPPAVVVRYLRGPAPPPEALPVLDELRASRAEILAALTRRPTSLNAAAAGTVSWDDTWERARLSSTQTWCDEEKQRVESWPETWDWVRRERPDLVAAMDAALDALESAHQQRDVRRSIEACDLLQRAVQAAANAFLSTMPGMAEAGKGPC